MRCTVDHEDNYCDKCGGYQDDDAPCWFVIDDDLYASEDIEEHLRRLADDPYEHHLQLVCRDCAMPYIAKDLDDMMMKGILDIRYVEEEGDFAYTLTDFGEQVRDEIMRRRGENG